MLGYEGAADKTLTGFSTASTYPGCEYPVSVQAEVSSEYAKYSLAIPEISPEAMKLSDEKAAAKMAAIEAANAAEDARRRQLEVLCPSIERALAAYAELDDGALESVRIRADFVRLAKPRGSRADGYSREEDLRSRPPATRMVARKRHSLKLMLSMIYVAHLDSDSHGNFVNDRPNTPRRGGRASWLELAGLRSKPGGAPSVYVRAWRRQVTTAIRNLVEIDLASLTGTQGAAGRYNRFQLLEETGVDSRVYRVPGERQAATGDAIEVPADFFRKGWHLVLTDLEIVTLLAIIHRTWVLRNATRSRGFHDVGVDLKESVRWDTYGLSGEAYSTVHLLDRFDCIDLTDPMVNRRGTRQQFQPLNMSGSTDEHQAGNDEETADEARETYRLIYPSESAETNGHAFSREALSTVQERLFRAA